MSINRVPLAQVRVQDQPALQTLFKRMTEHGPPFIFEFSRRQVTWAERRKGGSIFRFADQPFMVIRQATVEEYEKCLGRLGYLEPRRKLAKYYYEVGTD